MGGRSGVVPESVKRLEEQLRQFRGTHAKRRRLPEALWQRAVEEARQHGTYKVAHSLRLDYSNLQKRLGGAPTRKRVRDGGDRNAGQARQQRPAASDPGAAPPAFVELARSASISGDEYVVEFESVAGPRMRVRWRGTTPEWSSLLRAWGEVAG